RSHRGRRRLHQVDVPRRQHADLARCRWCWFLLRGAIGENLITFSPEGTMRRSLTIASTLALLLVGAVAHAQERYALVIGIKGYPNFAETRKLKYADNDAVQFARFLQTPQGGAVPPSHVKLLTNNGATR